MRAFLLRHLGQRAGGITRMRAGASVLLLAGWQHQAAARPGRTVVFYHAIGCSTCLLSAFPTCCDLTCYIITAWWELWEFAGKLALGASIWQEAACPGLCAWWPEAAWHGSLRVCVWLAGMVNARFSIAKEGEK